MDEYKFSVHDIIVDFYIAQAKLNRTDCTIEQLRRFNDTCLDMAEICELNGRRPELSARHGQTPSPLSAGEMGNADRDRLFRITSLPAGAPVNDPFVSSTDAQRRLGLGHPPAK